MEQNGVMSDAVLLVLIPAVVTLVLAFLAEFDFVQPVRPGAPAKVPRDRRAGASKARTSHQTAQ